MSTEREDAEVALIKARTGLAKSCDYAVYWLHLILCVLGGMAIGGSFGEHATACAFWRSIESECHDSTCLLEASKTRPWSCGPDDRSVVVEAVAKTVFAVCVHVDLHAWCGRARPLRATLTQPSVR